MAILKIKSGITTKEFTLDYDSMKDKFYLSVRAYVDLRKETFFGEWALTEYLRSEWDFNDEQIKELLNNVYQEVA